MVCIIRHFLSQIDKRGSIRSIDVTIKTLTLNQNRYSDVDHNFKFDHYQTSMSLSINGCNYYLNSLEEGEDIYNSQIFLAALAILEC